MRMSVCCFWVIIFCFTFRASYPCTYSRKKGRGTAFVPVPRPLMMVVVGQVGGGLGSFPLASTPSPVAYRDLGPTPCCGLNRFAHSAPQRTKRIRTALALVRQP